MTATSRDPAEALREHIELFNLGVRTGDFSQMARALHPDVDMRFVGIPVGPFRGRDAVEAAYLAQPPDDEIVPLELHVDGDVGTAEYSWSADADGRPAGRLAVELASDGRIGSVEIDYYAAG